MPTSASEKAWISSVGNTDLGTEAFGRTSQHSTAPSPLSPILAGKPVPASPPLAASPRSGDEFQIPYYDCCGRPTCNLLFSFFNLPWFFGGVLQTRLHLGDEPPVPLQICNRSLLCDVFSGVSRLAHLHLESPKLLLLCCHAQQLCRRERLLPERLLKLLIFLLQLVSEGLTMS